MLFSWVQNLLTGRDHSDHAAAAEWDRKYGTETDAGVPLDNLTIRHASRQYGERYQASDPRVLRDCVKFIGLAPAGYRFVDLGCGKGRMLIVAAELGFQSCTGVEFADELAAAAARNVAASGFQNIGIVHGDAGAYAFRDEPFVLYMFNPFSRQVMERVRDNLLKLRRANYYIIYKNARERSLFDKMPTLRYLGSPRQHRGLWGTHIWVPRG
ncbi:MAG: class I SAM-dependent methyltransferase [Rhodopseudomonas sp.]|uniref:class I SAM-dependent methyltransferase n=1 Tax=Rhodopseudomonas sp. TaxID=1078 RepID=UPI001803BDC4|nr:class I SAM-dependent methyltransferase [Rhodopseudomonas sp.]NVN86747.1 class I SAM-dependent methyltransferase [Rhodopseudomonas sp.]